DRSVHLWEADPNPIQVATSMLSALLDRYVRKLDPPLPQGTAQSADEPEVKPEPFYIRFLRLGDWNSAESVALPKFSSVYVRGRAILDVTNPQQSVVFAQIARTGGSVLNVAMPSAGVLRPMRCQLVVSASKELLTAYVRLSTEWANGAMQYMARGYMDQAKQLVLTASERQPSGLARLVQKMANRFDDPAAAFVPRYVGLRTHEASVMNTLGESFLDLLQQHLSDGFVISAELAARERQFKQAAEYITSLRPGAMPLFTEGFSLLIHRLRELLDLDLELTDEDRRPSPAHIAKLKELWQTLSRWAPYVNLNSPTVTFFGNDIAAPKADETPVVPTMKDGWIRGPTIPNDHPYTDNRE
ncbi:MAG: hypothetical protein JO151_18155, partial [Verrucomicrobia bacterium]|nr:hypothetical protein [Verrucomicrobiota bacterium]